MFQRNTIYLVFIASLTLAGCQRKNLSANKKPNVVFILVDDLGLHDLGVTGSNFYETPNIDQLANEGMIFTQGYAASRVCSPSRASIMTGKFTARHGITDWIGAKSGEKWREHERHDKLLPAEYVRQLPQKDLVIAEVLKAKGYKTFFAGKWHLGGEGSYPEEHGFDINVGGWDKGSPIGGYFAPWKNPKLNNIDYGENLSIRLAKETSSFIKKNKDSSFFAFLSFYAVHGPIQTDMHKWKKYQEKAKENGIAEKGYVMEKVLPIRHEQDNPIYAGLVESMDEAVGLVLQALKTANIDRETIVIFTSDNGGVASGDSFSTSNLPLRGGKGYQWEGGIREPFFIKVPWLNHKGVEHNFPVIGTDFYPTILDLLNIDLLPNQHIDGVSLNPILEGKSLSVQRPLFWHYPHYGNQGGSPSSIIRKGNWKLIHYWEDSSDELYNLSIDIEEKNNLAIEFPDKLITMRSELLQWLAGVNANRPEIDSLYDPMLAAERHEEILTQKLPQLEMDRLQILSDEFIGDDNWWGSHLTKD